MLFKNKVKKIEPIDDTKTIPFKIREIHQDNDMMFKIVLVNENNTAIVISLSPSQFTHIMYYGEDCQDFHNYYTTPYEHFLELISRIGGELLEITVVGDKYGIPYAQITWKRDNFIESFPVSAADAIIYSSISGYDLHFTKKFIESLS